MNQMSSVLADLIEEFALQARDNNRQYRLLVPCPSRGLAEDLHSSLLGRDLPSFLVVGGDESTSADSKRIRPSGLTSKRIGSFVATTMPGQLAHIHDSIRGSGGAVRAVAFSEEWPWVDDGDEAFQFENTVLPRLLPRWTDEEHDQIWLREFIIRAVVPATLSIRDRVPFVIDHILGQFNPDEPESVGSVCDRFLVHCGVPGPATGDVTKFIQSVDRLCRKMLDRIRTDDDVRAQVIQRVPDVVTPSSERAEVAIAVNDLMDGIGLRSKFAAGPLALGDCWPCDGGRSWGLLSMPRLANLFDVAPPPAVDLGVEITSPGAMINDAQSFVATWLGADIRFRIDYSITPADFNNVTHRLVLVSGRTELHSEVLQDPQGTIHYDLAADNAHLSHKRKIILRVRLYAGDHIAAEHRVDLHVQGPERPSFVVIEPGLAVVDLVHQADLEEGDVDSLPEVKIVVKEPAYLHFFHENGAAITVEDFDGQADAVDACFGGIANRSRTSDPVDPVLSPVGNVQRICRCDDAWALVTLETLDATRGEFTLEDELRVRLSSPHRSVQEVRVVAARFTGDDPSAYRLLGGINDRSRRRLYLAKHFEAEHNGYAPVVCDLFRFESISLDCEYRIGEEVQRAPRQPDLQEDDVQAVATYARSREALQNFVQSLLDADIRRLEHPVYAAYPLYSSSRVDDGAQLVVEYLRAYHGVLRAAKRAAEELVWGNSFLLSHLDTVVHWSNDALKYQLFLLGPWHPLVVAKRFMVQRALVARAARLSGHTDDAKAFRQLVTLLSRVSGFRWVPCVRVDEAVVVPSYACATSDPGWHCALQREIRSAASHTPLATVDGIFQQLNESLDLEAAFDHASLQDLPRQCLSDFVRAYPSRRAIGMRVKEGYTATTLLRSIDSALHDADGPSEFGEWLPGGVNVYVQKPPPDVGDVSWERPPIRLFAYSSDAECYEHAAPDLMLLPAVQNLEWSSSRYNCHQVRGGNEYAVFSSPGLLVTEGESGVPASIVDEAEGQPSEVAGHGSVGEIFTTTLAEITSLVGPVPSLLRTVDLPQRLPCPWAIVPGAHVDPALLVRYVQDGMSRSDQERALWDYRIDVASQQSSYFVLSTIPPSFRVTVGTVFSDPDLASHFIGELGQIGLAIGGEALVTGRKALGVIGLIGGVRLFMSGAEKHQPLRTIGRRAGVLLPVDAFHSLLGASSGRDSDTNQRTDLLALQLDLSPNRDHVAIQVCGIECKYVSHTYPPGLANSALAQAQETANRLRDMILLAREQTGVAERLALHEIIRFGLRLTSRSDAQWQQTESSIRRALLNGRISYERARTSAVLVSTENGLSGTAELNRREQGWWIRLTPHHWPGTRETDSLNSIVREPLSTLFGNPEADEGGHGNNPDGPVTSTPPDSSATPAATEGTALEQTAQVRSTEGQADEPVDNMAAAREINESPEQVISHFERIEIGVSLDRKPVYFDPQAKVRRLENMNIMITGSSGTGKTQLLKYLVREMRRRRVGVLLLDMKNDFAGDLSFVRSAELDRHFVAFDGLPFNPLIPYPLTHPGTGERVIQCGQHIAGLASVLRSTYGLGAQQEASVKRSIAAAFEEAGISPMGTNRYNPSQRFPDFAVVGEYLRAENLGAYNRLDPLFTLELFRSEFRGKAFSAVLQESSILDLSQIPSDEIKNALARLTVMSAHSFYNARPHSGGLRQVLAFDEAHRVIESPYMKRLVRECRAYGVSTVLSSQYPADFSADVSASMHTKIIHGNGRDVERVREICSLLGCQGRESDVAELGMFEAIVSNRHYTNTVIRTMNYPVSLVQARLQQLGSMSMASIKSIEGLDPEKMAIEQLVSHLERMGLAEREGGHVRAVVRQTE